MRNFFNQKPEKRGDVFESIIRAPKQISATVVSPLPVSPFPFRKA